MDKVNPAQSSPKTDAPIRADEPVNWPHSTERQATLSSQTRGEHDSLLAAMHRLEAALAAAAPGRQQAWGARVQDDLRLVHEALARHVASAEGPGGLLAAIDLSRPAIVRRVERLRREHADLLQQANDLQRRVERLSSAEWTAYEACLADEVLDDPDAADIRRQAAQLLNALRSHQAHESDLIFESFCTDIGTGD
jgi:mannose/cellobiose epimerase-like protein (N-acyl-D-glucosamine 2-epimerase family)